MAGTSGRPAAQKRVASYHEAELAELVRQVGAAIDRFRSGEVDAFEVDQVIFSTAGQQMSCGSSATWVTSSSPRL